MLIFAWLNKHVETRSKSSGEILTRGAFYNYFDKIWPNFDPPPPRVDKSGHFTYFLHTTHDPQWTFKWPPAPFFLVRVVIWKWPLSTTFNLKVNCNFQLVTLFRVIGPWIFLHHNCTINATNYPIRRKNCVVIFSTHLGTYIEIIARTWQLQSGLQSGFFPEVWRQIYYVILFLTYLSTFTLVQEVLYIIEKVDNCGSVME